MEFLTSALAREEKKKNRTKEGPSSNLRNHMRGEVSNGTGLTYASFPPKPIHAEHSDISSARMLLVYTLFADYDTDGIAIRRVAWIRLWAA